VHGADRVGTLDLADTVTTRLPLAASTSFSFIQDLSDVVARIEIGDELLQVGPSASRADTMRAGGRSPPPARAGTRLRTSSGARARTAGRARWCRGFGVMTWESWVFAGSRPSASTRNSASRLGEDAGEPAALHDQQRADAWRFISFAAAADVVSAPAKMGFCCPMMVRIGLSSMARSSRKHLLSVRNMHCKSFLHRKNIDKIFPCARNILFPGRRRLPPHRLHRVGRSRQSARRGLRHGLARNSRDFDFLAEALAVDCRVVCMDVVDAATATG